MSVPYRFCPGCATPLEWLGSLEDGGHKERLRCPACGFTHWNNPTPVLAAVIECTDRGGRVLLARNAAWSGKMYGLVTGFLEKDEAPEDGIRREVKEELDLDATAAHLVGLYPFARRNELIIAYHVPAVGTVRLNEELADYRRIAPEKLRPWDFGTGLAVADWLKRRQA